MVYDHRFWHSYLRGPLNNYGFGLGLESEYYRVLLENVRENVTLFSTNLFFHFVGGGLLIGELFLNDDKSGPFYPITFDLLMLVTCQRGARERSGHEYQKLIEKHGFVQVRYKKTGNNSLDAVFAVKP